MFEYLQRQRDAFELFKQAYRAHFPVGAGASPQVVQLNVDALEDVDATDDAAAAARVLCVALDATLLVCADDGLFAEIEWL